MKRTLHKQEGLAVGCAMSGLLEMLTRPWTLHILWLLSANGPMRFGAMRRGVEGISARLLTVRLRTLEEQGFVTRTARPTNPPEVTYSPTPRLDDIKSIMAQLHVLSDKWKAEDATRWRQQDATHQPLPEATSEAQPAQVADSLAA
jgi:DNA-binding HxlR family transcriptional regulator